jgi:hypothetical protein
MSAHSASSERAAYCERRHASDAENSSRPRTRPPNARSQIYQPHALSTLPPPRLSRIRPADRSLGESA